MVLLHSSDILKSKDFLNSSIKLINLTDNIGYGHGIKEGIKNIKADLTLGLMETFKHH